MRLMNWLIVASLTVGLPTGSSAAKFNQDDLFKTAQTPNASGAFASTVSTINATDKAAKARQYLPLANSKIAQEPNNDALYAARAQIYYDLCDYQRAIQDISRAIELKPSTQAYYEFRGDSFTRLKNYSSAVKDFDQAIAIGPARAELLRWRGDCLYCLGHFSDALKDANQSIILDPKRATSFVLRGFAKLRLKDYVGAKIDCEQAASLEPMNHALTAELNHQLSVVNKLK